MNTLSQLENNKLFFILRNIQVCMFLLMGLVYKYSDTQKYAKYFIQYKSLNNSKPHHYDSTTNLPLVSYCRSLI